MKAHLIAYRKYRHVSTSDRRVTVFIANHLLDTVEIEDQIIQYSIIKVVRKGGGKPSNTRPSTFVSTADNLVRPTS